MMVSHTFSERFVRRAKDYQLSKTNLKKKTVYCFGNILAVIVMI